MHPEKLAFNAEEREKRMEDREGTWRCRECLEDYCSILLLPYSISYILVH